jgi:hypothetical protein
MPHGTASPASKDGRAIRSLLRRTKKAPSVAEATEGIYFIRSTLAEDGGPYWTRTSDLFHVKETL